MLSTIELSTFALANNVVPELTHIIHRPYYDEESWLLKDHRHRHKWGIPHDAQTPRTSLE